METRSKLIPSDKVVGRTVLSANGQAIGKAVGLLIDLDDWRVADIEVLLNRDMAKPLGLRKGMFRPPTIRIASSAVQSVADAIILARSIDALRAQLSAGSEPEEAGPAVH
ncbi:MAG: hypothetical protein IRZ16_06745 [Myxococcaceae bacterium]|nr:hypothetical protein [Myxococcaceae bacterium]